MAVAVWRFWGTLKPIVPLLFSMESHVAVALNTLPQPSESESESELDKLRSQVVQLQQELTACKRAEAELENKVAERTIELEQQKNLLELVMDAIPQHIFWKDKDSVYLGCNGNFARAAGFNTPQEVIGKTDYDMVWKPEEADWYRELDRRVISSNFPQKAVIEPQTHADGKHGWSRTTKVPLHDKAGNVVGILGTFEDVTELFAAQAELEASQRKLSAVLSNLPGMAYSCNNDQGWSMNFVSEGSFALTGYRPDQLLNGTVPYREIIHPDDQEMLWREVQLAIADNRSYQVVYRICPVNQREKWVWEQGRGIFSPAGELLSLEGFITDITERKRAEEALQRSESQLRQQAQELEQTLWELQRTQSRLVQSEKMSSLGQLVAGVAHEINNPVNFISGNLTYANDYTRELLHLVSLYQEHYPNPVPVIQQQAETIDLPFLLEDLPRLLASMKVGAERIQKIVASLRNFSRMDESEVKSVDIHEGIDSTLMILQNRTKARSDRPGIEILKDYGSLPLVECHAGQLNQVFMNLLSNAIDALEEKSGQLGASFTPTIRIHTRTIEGDSEESSSGKRISIHISDNGPGMPEAVCSRIFDPFFTTKPVGKGTGMGLSISYQVVTERHGGTLHCHSQPGEGAEFVIEIPIAPPQSFNSNL